MSAAHSAAILGCEGPVLGVDERAFFADARPWGFILFTRNLEAPDQIRRLVADLRDAVGWDAPILIDQEGGRVQRIGPPHWRQWHPPLDQMERGGGDPFRAMWLRARLIAHELTDLGIDVNCAPTADVARPETHPFLRNRCYGSDVPTVLAAARAVADGLLAGGVLPVMKHIPGHGAARVDSHLDLPVVDVARKELLKCDFATFAAMAGLPMAMTAHVVYKAIDADLPATISPKMIALIRNKLGFRGLLMSDDISMQALPGDLAARCRAARDAGCDLILHCNGDLAEMRVAVDQAGTLQDKGLRRAKKALTARRAAEPLDVAAAEAELSDLLGGQVYG